MWLTCTSKAGDWSTLVCSQAMSNMVNGKMDCIYIALLSKALYN
uniref:Uncharacterized protein n=2 Tax=Anguilla anguilla TaxID=7936 RepID=A0A0E9TZE0_ANGAN